MNLRKAEQAKHFFGKKRVVLLWNPGTAQAKTNYIEIHLCRHCRFQCINVCLKTSVILAVQFFRHLQLRFDVTGKILSSQHPTLVICMVDIINLRILVNSAFQNLCQLIKCKSGRIHHPSKINTTVGIDTGCQCGNSVLLRTCKVINSSVCCVIYFFNTKEVFPFFVHHGIILLKTRHNNGYTI